MRVRIDKECDALYIRLKDAKIASSEENEHGFIVDFDENNSIVGFEIVGVSSIVPKESLGFVSVDYGTALV